MVEEERRKGLVIAKRAMGGVVEGESERRKGETRGSMSVETRNVVEGGNTGRDIQQGEFKLWSLVIWA